jgi:hypothetical protein
MQTKGKRDQKGVWQRAAPCLFRYRGGTYYAVVRRSGKIVRKSLETDRIEIDKRMLRDLLNEVERIGVEAHNRKFGEVIDEFVSSRTGAPVTSCVALPSGITRQLGVCWLRFN